MHTQLTLFLIFGLIAVEAQFNFGGGALNKFKKKKPFQKPTLPPKPKEKKFYCPDDNCLDEDILEKLRRAKGDIMKLAQEFKIQGVQKTAVESYKGKKANIGACKAPTIEKFIVPVPSSLSKNEGKKMGKHYDFSSNSVEIRALADEEAACMPRDQVVPLKVPPGTFYITPCATRQKRCGGCCSTLPGQMECVADTIKKGSVSVLTMMNAYPYYSFRALEVHDHVKCKCQCKTQASHCTPEQVYVSKNCQCMCPTARIQCSGPKSWSPSKCGCVCHTKLRCSPNHQWNEDNCSCECSKVPCTVPGAVRDPDVGQCKNRCL